MPNRDEELERKIRWFHAGAAEFATSCPDVIGELGPALPAVYCCPLCLRNGRFRLFPEEAVHNGSLTFEHVPPDHCGGQPLVLTCKRCNVRAGHTIDQAAAEVEQGRRFLAGVGPATVQVRAGDKILPATMSWSATDVLLDGLPVKPERVAAFEAAFVDRINAGKIIKLSFSIRTMKSRVAMASWLKSAYLATFALFGYGYAFSPLLDKVREQIQQPKRVIIPTYVLSIGKDLPFPECRVFLLKTEALPTSIGVQMGPYLVLLPANNSGKLYECLEEMRNQPGSVGIGEYAAKDSVWPTEPIFAAKSSLLRTA